ncbi:Hydrolase (HAD superfamily) [Candidatus Burkholderia humilis]|nr:Hydrolase (HAD superfamily) [Candidatus Burkholderia humilis]
MDTRYGLHSVSGNLERALDKLAKVELVVTDCDGTLLYTDKSLGNRAIAAVKELRAAGVEFTVASSRSGRGMRHIVEPLGIDMPYASYNGGSLVMPKTWQVLSSHKLPRDVVQTALELLATAGVDAWVFIDDAWYLTNPDATYVSLETRTVGYKGMRVTRFDDLDLDTVEVR